MAAPVYSFQRGRIVDTGALAKHQAGSVGAVRLLLGVVSEKFLHEEGARSDTKRKKGAKGLAILIQAGGAQVDKSCMSARLLTYYEAIEKASRDMLEAARIGNWERVVEVEGVCGGLISQLKHAADHPLTPGATQRKSHIMRRILINDAEIRLLAEPWVRQVDSMLSGRWNALH
jgi:flagellar protein FliT